MHDALDGRVEVLLSLRPSTAVSTPSGAGVVMVQSRDKVAVLIGQTVVQFDRYQVEPIAIRAEVEPVARPVTDAAFRGLGRAGFRNGLLMHQAVTWAEQQVGRELLVIERLLVCDGYVAEQRETEAP